MYTHIYIYTHVYAYIYIYIYPYYSITGVADEDVDEVLAQEKGRGRRGRRALELGHIM